MTVGLRSGFSTEALGRFDMTACRLRLRRFDMSGCLRCPCVLATWLKPMFLQRKPLAVLT